MSTRRKQPHAPPRITAPRAPTATAGSAPAYPTADAMGAAVRDRARRLAEKLMIAGAAVGLAAAAAGCQPPECQPTRVGEVKVHGATALTDVLGGDLTDAKTELGVGLGITPHPSMAVAGEMVAVVPFTSTVTAPTPPSTPPSGGSGSAAP